MCQNCTPTPSLCQPMGAAAWASQGTVQRNHAKGRTQGCGSHEGSHNASSWSRQRAEQATPKTSPRPRQSPGLPTDARAALTFHRGGQGRDSGLRIAQEHLLVQAAQRMEGGVCVLLYKQVSSIDLVDHDDLHSDAVGEHEL